MYASSTDLNHIIMVSASANMLHERLASLMNLESAKKNQQVLNTNLKDFDYSKEPKAEKDVFI